MFFVLFMYPCLIKSSMCIVVFLYFSWTLTCVIKSSMCIVLNYIYHGFIFITMCASIFFESKRQLHNGFIGKCQEPFFKEHNNCSNQSINAYRIVASTNMCHFSENQIFTVSNSNTPIFFRNKTFLFFKLESWNFQVQFEIQIC